MEKVKSQIDHRESSLSQQAEKSCLPHKLFFQPAVGRSKDGELAVMAPGIELVLN
jgi:hypothetical protein